jgi:hypothetical protein
MQTPTEERNTMKDIPAKRTLVGLTYRLPVTLTEAQKEANRAWVKEVQAREAREGKAS